MGRIRTIKPEFPQSESMGRISRDARLTFILLWTMADDAGRLRGHPKLVANLLFPCDDDAGENVETWLGELVQEGCIARYKADGHHYIEICQWRKHQKIDHPTASRFPENSQKILPLANPREDSPLDLGGDQGEEGMVYPVTPRPKLAAPPTLPTPQTRCLPPASPSACHEETAAPVADWFWHSTVQPTSRESQPMREADCSFHANPATPPATYPTKPQILPAEDWHCQPASLPPEPGYPAKPARRVGLERSDDPPFQHRPPCPHSPPHPPVVGRGEAGTMERSAIAPIEHPPRGRKSVSLESICHDVQGETIAYNDSPCGAIPLRSIVALRKPSRHRLPCPPVVGRGAAQPEQWSKAELRRSSIRPEGANPYLWNQDVMTCKGRQLRTTIPHAAQFRYASLSPYANRPGRPPHPPVVRRGAAGTMEQSAIAPVEHPPRGRKSVSLESICHDVQGETIAHPDSPCGAIPLRWAAQYDEGPQEGRSLARHTAWLEQRHCPVLRLEGELTQAAQCAALAETLSTLSDAGEVKVLAQALLPASFGASKA